MNVGVQNNNYFPLNFPMIFSGKLTSKIVIKKDYVRADGTSALYLQIFLDGVQKRIPLKLFVKVQNFDKIKQRVKIKTLNFQDYNLLIEQALASINTIEVNYRLSNEILTIEKLLYEYANPTSRIDFIKFWEVEMEHQKLTKDIATYKQQMSTLRKVKKYKSSILFYELTKPFFEKMIGHFEKVEKNGDQTIFTLKKNFKKYLHIANDLGIKTPLSYKDIKTPSPISKRTFLNEKEINSLHQYYCSDFINENLKSILAQFLFSCFTGLRISDSQAITTNNIIGDVLAFTSIKTGKFQRIKLIETAMALIGKDTLFPTKYSEKHINEELKVIAKTCGITKKITFHVSRHSFATNFLMCGGRVEALQKLLGHSSIRETMVYVHIVDSVMDTQIFNMDKLIIKKPLL
jgi:prepilin-type processing-associated H-X9-DG protein